ncbi:MAG: acyltransferase [Rhodospirillaceae bacterium]|nr:acyltransferase [Rhodospirillaceae bacterium]
MPDHTRFREIDGLRGLCALAVMLFHYLYRNPLIPAGSDAYARLPQLPGVPDRVLGELAVYVFFMISGFVISYTLAGARRPLDFVVSRATRLYPAYWCAATLTFFAWSLSAPMPWQVDTRLYLINLTMLQGFVGLGHVDGVYWSLTAELGFYGLMFALFAAGKFHRLLFAAAGWLAAGLAFGIACDLVGPRNVPVPTLVAVALNLDFTQYFVAGIVFHRAWTGGWSRPLLALLAACIAGFFVFLPWAAAAVMAAVCGLWALIIAGRAGVLAWPPLAALGGISYALYITHRTLGYHVMLALPDVSPAGRIAAACAVSLALAALVTLAVERPALNALRRAYRGRGV